MTAKPVDSGFITLISREEIARRVAELGAAIARNSGDKPLCLVPVMDGGMIFAADLMRSIQRPLEVMPIKASSYGDDCISSGIVYLPEGIPLGVEGKDILLIDDILDTGLTLSFLKERILAERAANVRTCVLLRKHSSARLHADYIGFEIPDHFVVGYGLDLAGLHRNLPDIMYQPFLP
jgi:hypoxanthine phosphoribosyltransferase